MILLIREEAMMSVTDTKSFKFHYDSINSTPLPLYPFDRLPDLNSIMILLIRLALSVFNRLLHNLNSIMILLIRMDILWMSIL